jgi:hypothetical protein
MNEADLHRLIDRVLVPEQVAYEEGYDEPIPFQPRTPSELAARRLAWEAAAVLIAANNRWLTRQLRALGLQPAPPVEERDAWITGVDLADAPHA